jgi:hypothetical protein
MQARDKNQQNDICPFLLGIGEQPSEIQHMIFTNNYHKITTAFKVIRFESGGATSMRSTRALG